jgi:hypothetical protein
MIFTYGQGLKKATNMSRELIIRLIFDLIYIIIALVLIYWKSFSSEKGKNLATKKDIGEITKEIEQVKNELSFKNQSKRDWFLESKKNLLDFYDAYLVWVDNSLRISDILISHNDNELIIRETIKNLKESHSAVLKYYWRLRIYEDDSIFINSISKIYNNTGKKHNVVLRLLLSLEDIVFQHKKLIEKNKYGIDVTTEFENLRKEKNEAFKEYDKGKDSSESLIAESKKNLVKIFKKKMNQDYAQFDDNIRITKN